MAHGSEILLKTVCLKKSALLVLKVSCRVLLHYLTTGSTILMMVGVAIYSVCLANIVTVANLSAHVSVHVSVDRIGLG